MARQRWIFAKSENTLQTEEYGVYSYEDIQCVYGRGSSLVPGAVPACAPFARAWQHEVWECTQNWNFLYIDDAAAALVSLLTEAPAGVYNIGSSDTRPLRSYIEEMYALCGHCGSYSYGARPPECGGPADLMPDISRILQGRLPGGLPQHLRRGIYETLHSLGKLLPEQSLFELTSAPASAQDIRMRRKCSRMRV